MPEPHRDAGTQMRRLHPSPTGPHPYPWTQPIQHQGTSIVSQAGARTRPILHMPRRPRARRLRQTQGALRKTKHNRRPLPIRKNRTHRHATQPQRPEVRTRPMQTMPRRENRQNKTSRLQHQTINRNTVHHDKNSRQHPQGGWGDDHPAWTAGELSVGCAGFKHRWRTVARAVSSICR